MADLAKWWNGFWDNVQHSPAILPTHHHFQHEPGPSVSNERFRRDEHYFGIRINRIFLQYGREFWATYAPMAVIVTEFMYDGKDKVVPFVVGPSMLEDDKIELPQGFLFKDIRVAGLHPYRGGGLKVSVILYKVKRSDGATKLLKAVENLGSVLDFSQSLSTYLKIASVVVETVGDVIGMDPSNQPIVGLRQEYTDGHDVIPGYYALVESNDVAQNDLTVKQGDLYLSKDGGEQKFAGANFVVYSIDRRHRRDDFESLPFYDDWKVALAEAHTANQEQWKSARANWANLYQRMSLSPDLISDHADELSDECWNRMDTTHKKILARMGHMGAGDQDRVDVYEGDRELAGISSRLDRVRAKALSVLDD